MVVADPSEKLVEVKVDEADIAQVHEGQQADIYTAAWPDTPLTGTVESIATTARQNPGQRSLSFLVKILLEDTGEVEFLSGMSARADIYTESSDRTLAVPVQAVRFEEAVDADESDEEAQTYVFIVEDGKAVRRDVKTGIASDSEQEILEGLDEGEKVVTGPFRVLRSLRDGDEVVQREESDDEDQEA